MTDEPKTIEGREDDEEVVCLRIGDVILIFPAEYIKHLPVGDDQSKPMDN